MTEIVETDPKVLMRRTALWVIRARKAAAEAAEDLARAEDAFTDRAILTGINHVDTEEAAVTLVFSHRDTVSVDVLEKRLPENVLLEVTKRTVNTKPFNDYVKYGLIAPEIAKAATVRKEFTQVKVDVH